MNAGNNGRGTDINQNKKATHKGEWLKVWSSDDVRRLVSEIHILKIIL